MRKPLKIDKQLRTDTLRLLRPSCGTLNYMAECRGCVKRTEPAKWQSPGTNRIVRNYSPWRGPVPKGYVRNAKAYPERRKSFIV